MSDTDVSDNADESTDRLDPRAPRFGQSVTATLLLAGIVAQSVIPIAVASVVLVTAVVTRWRVDIYGLLWRHSIVRIAGEPDDAEPASPHRFAKLLGAVGTSTATTLLAIGWIVPGYAVAAVVATLASVAAITGFCLGCRMYRQVAFLRRHGVV